MDQGILHSFKCKYKKLFLKKMLNACNSNSFGIEAFRKEFSIKDAIWDCGKSLEQSNKQNFKICMVQPNAEHNIFLMTKMIMLSLKISHVRRKDTHA